MNVREIENARKKFSVEKAHTTICVDTRRMCTRNQMICTRLCAHNDRNACRYILKLFQVKRREVYACTIYFWLRQRQRVSSVANVFTAKRNEKCYVAMMALRFGRDLAAISPQYSFLVSGMLF